MSKTAFIENAVAAAASPALPAADWDLVSFLGNAKNYGQVVGGALISLLGLIILIVAIVFVTKKFLGNGQNDKSWIVIVVMVIIGGALMTGGIVLITNIASGGQRTVEELGGGLILLGLLR